ncbi:MAG: hypothetical protein IID39_01205 [Planctomycetes bacterium]|nr:hypothetical protein [Planctomycetota bacterium]
MNKSDLTKLIVAGGLLLTAGTWWLFSSSDADQQATQQVDSADKPAVIADIDSDDEEMKKSRRSRISEDIG